MPHATHQLWILVPWSVFALAAGLKFWRISAGIRRQLGQRNLSTEQARAALERLWQQDEQTA